MRIGVLTGGGDCPGLNAVIRAVVRKGVKEYGHEFVGFRDGWKGPLEGLTKHFIQPIKNLIGLFSVFYSTDQKLDRFNL